MMKIGTITLTIVVLMVLLAACGPTPAESPSLPEEVTAALAEQDGAYVILTLSNTLDAALVQRLAEAGILLFDPLGNNQFQAYLPATAVPALTALRTDGTVTGVMAIDPASKIRGEFSDAQETYAVIVHFYAAPTEGETAVITAQMQVEKTAVGVMNFVEGQATGAQIREMANLPFVKGIEAAVISTGGD
jgi:hypothetical protein